MKTPYRGRIAPSPTGYLHEGHAATFRIAHRRARDSGGSVIFRMEDLDPDRCSADFRKAALDDLRWLGLDWDEGPDVGGNFGPYIQSQRMSYYREAFENLKTSGFLFPCKCTRKNIRDITGSLYGADEEPIYSGSCRMREPEDATENDAWRFRVPEGERITFFDGALGELSYVAGKDFGDFLVWRRDGIPSYQLAVVVDDYLMDITEIVRGQDLLVSTARQILLYRALGWAIPKFYHCPLILDANGNKLSKRDAAARFRR